MDRSTVLDLMVSSSVPGIVYSSGDHMNFIFSRLGLVAGLAMMLTFSAQSADKWAFGGELFANLTSEGQQAYLFIHKNPSQKDCGLPGIAYKPTHRVGLKAVSVLMKGDPSDIATHYFGVYVNTLENFRSNALRGQFFQFDPGQLSTFVAEPWEPNGTATDLMIITLIFSQPVELTPDHSWMISPVIKLDAFQDQDYLPSMIACQSSSVGKFRRPSGFKIDEYASQTVTLEGGEYVTRSSSVAVSSQFAADLLISAPPRFFEKNPTLVNFNAPSVRP